jgi:hypothetical protein
VSEFPKIIAQQGDDLLVALIEDSETAIGYVIGTDEDGIRWRYRDTLIGTIVAHSPGWEPHEGKLTVEQALRGAKSQ